MIGLRGYCFYLLVGLICLWHPWVWAESSCRSYSAAENLASLQDNDVDESSGLAASRRHLGVWWTHNDSGSKPRIYAFDLAGKKLGYFEVTGADAVDWEDMAAAPCEDGKPCLYIGDIGDNAKQRKEIVVYRVPEPDVHLNGNNKGSTAHADVFTLRYPDGAHDSEALLVHPKTRDIWIVTKTTNGKAGVYKLSGTLKPGTHTLVKIAVLTFEGDLVTGGDFSPHGDQFVLRGYVHGLVYHANASGIPQDQDKLQTIETGPTLQGEAIAYSADATFLLVTSEGVPAPLLKLACKTFPTESSQQEVSSQESTEYESSSELATEIAEPPTEIMIPTTEVVVEDAGESGISLDIPTIPPGASCTCANPDGSMHGMGWIFWLMAFVILARES